MATDVDVHGIIKRIVDILDSDATLFDATGANGKVRKIESGALRMPIKVVETTLPHIWVTSENTLDLITQIGASASNAIKGLSHTLFFKIILIAKEKDGFKVEEVLDDFVKLINQDITANRRLKDPAAANDPLVDSCIVQQVRELDTSLTGLDRQGRIVILKAVKVTG